MKFICRLQSAVEEFDGCGGDVRAAVVLHEVPGAVEEHGFFGVRQRLLHAFQRLHREDGVFGRPEKGDGYLGQFVEAGFQSLHVLPTAVALGDGMVRGQVRTTASDSGSS